MSEASVSGLASEACSTMEDRESGAVVHEPEMDDADDYGGGKKSIDEGESGVNLLPSDEQLDYAMKRASLSPRDAPQAVKYDVSVLKGKELLKDSLPSHQPKAKNFLKGKCKPLSISDVKAVAESRNLSAEEKIKQLQVMLVQQVKESIATDRDMQAAQKRIDQLCKEKEAAAGELVKGGVQRGKLESLCRELQKQNKTIVEETRKTALAQQEKSEQMSTKFLNSIKDIEVRMNHQNSESELHLKENLLLTEQLSKLQEQMDVREKYHTHLVKAKDLEIELLNAKLRQQEQMTKEQAGLVRAKEDQVTELLAAEKALRAQLTLYTGRFEEFQSTLSKSNDFLTTMRKEMEKMNRRVVKLEVENKELRVKCEKSDVSIINMLDERTAMKKQVDIVTSQRDRLEGLCRMLQAERKSTNEVGASSGPSFKVESEGDEAEKSELGSNINGTQGNVP